MDEVNFRQTVCNGGWRLNAVGNPAMGPQDDLYVVFADNRNGDEFPFPTFLNADFTCPDGLHTSTDVFISRSVDGGVTWSSPRNISQDPPDFDNWFPWVDVAEIGQVWVVYYARRASGDNTLTDAWLAVSRDRGRHWPEQRVSDVSSDFWDDFLGFQFFIGDCNNLAAAGNRVYSVWTDGRAEADSDIFMDALNRDN
jgi:hypothetical protein